MMEAMQKYMHHKQLLWNGLKQIVFFATQHSPFILLVPRINRFSEGMSGLGGDVQETIYVQHPTSEQ
jgi:hypothetical protein